MSYKKATYLSLALMIVLAAFYYWAALDFQDNRNRNSVGPGYFPMILSVVLIILCIISWIQTIRKPDYKINIPNLRVIGLSLLAIALFLISWFFINLFYISCFVFLLVLSILYNPGLNRKSLVINLSTSLAITVFIYILFGLIIQVRFLV